MEKLEKRVTQALGRASAGIVPHGMQAVPTHGHGRNRGQGRQGRLLIVGCGEVGRRVLRHLSPGWQVLALVRTQQQATELRALGVRPLLGDLDQPASLGRLGALAECVLHLAPPPGHGQHDTRTQALLAALARGGTVSRLIYASTTGVYGDAQGQRVAETRPLAPANARAIRRADAESRVRAFGRAHGVAVSILRVPGIYAPGRVGGDPRERLLKRAPVLREQDDVFTNHIHAEDLARACVRTLSHGAPQRSYNVCDNSELRMGDYFDLAAQLSGLPKPTRISREEAQCSLPPASLSFMSESRRLSNQRLRQELKFKLTHPTVNEGLAPLRPAQLAGRAPRPI